MKSIKNEIVWIFLGAIFFVLIFSLGFYFGGKYQINNSKELNEKIIFQNTKIEEKEEPRLFCFYRKQEATETAPYKVEEFIELNIRDDKVYGKKRGFQIGEDMSNGYLGTLEGVIKDNQIEVVFDYEIEGSKNKELELYDLSPNELVKKRFVLADVEGVLTPQKDTEPNLIIYYKEECN